MTARSEAMRFFDTVADLQPGECVDGARRCSSDKERGALVVLPLGTRNKGHLRSSFRSKGGRRGRKRKSNGRGGARHERFVRFATCATSALSTKSTTAEYLTMKNLTVDTIITSWVV